MTFELQYVFSGILLHSYFLTVRISWCRHYGPLSAHFKKRPNWFAQQVGTLNSLAKIGPMGGGGSGGGLNNSEIECWSQFFIFRTTYRRDGGRWKPKYATTPCWENWWIRQQSHCLFVYKTTLSHCTLTPARARGYIDSLVVLSPAHKVCKIAGS